MGSPIVVVQNNKVDGKHHRRIEWNDFFFPLLLSWMTSTCIMKVKMFDTKTCLMGRSYLMDLY